MAIFSISYRQLSEILISTNRNVEESINVIKENNPDLCDENLEVFKTEFSKHFVHKFSEKWNKASRNRVYFFKKWESWLENQLSIGLSCKRYRDNFGGRPEKDFLECCNRTKRYKIKSLCDQFSDSLITEAAKNIKVTNNNAGSSTSGFTAEKALALLMDAQLSKHQYNVLKKACDDIGHNIFPCYNKILDAKKTCYPSNVEITETSATVPLQSLLDHTVTRIFEAKTEEEMSAFSNEMTLISKWGCDGSSGHSEYKQTFSDSEHSDSSLFLTSLVPLTLHQKNDLRKEFWANIRPSSTRLCRPIKFEFIKETGENTKREVARVEEEIKNLNDTVLIFQEREFKIAHTLLFTMIDGKIAQTLSGTSSMAVCCICKAKPSEMNNLDKCLLKEVNIDAFRFGMHPLHARIKFMECILHIAYNKDFQSWKTNKDTKVQKEATKRQIQEKFQEILGLKVDFVKQGMGTSNDGNTSRRFFSNPDITSEITGVDKDLIYRFSEILNKINSQDEINAVEFGNYCLETARLYIRLYDWYYMPNSVHKILLHGKEIILAAMLPIGKLTEEAQEARNKDYRNYRLNHSRKCSRISTNTDIFNMLFASSDPYLLKYRKEPKT